MKAGMDGSDPKAIIDKEIVWPNGVAIDQGSKRVYWVDPGMDRIETCDYFGAKRHIVSNNRDVKQTFGIDVLGDNVFWSKNIFLSKSIIDSIHNYIYK